jgi:hypothetical chaperone protein
MTTSCIGLDFGTTNSAVALATPDRRVQLATFPFFGQSRPAARSVVFFDPEDIVEGYSGRPPAVIGNKAIERYIDRDGEGRFIQSTKSWLASRGFDATDVYGRRVTLQELIALVVSDLRWAVEQQLGGMTPKIVAGRPVHFARADDAADDAFAEGRLREALALAGFTDITFSYEPVGAAWHYESRLDKDELVLIGDFGGGTSDFTLVRVGPGVRAGGAQARADAVLGTDGVGLAGDAFDAKIIRNVVAPRLGQGSEQRSSMGNATFPMPGWVFVHLERWHQLSMLKVPATLRRLRRMLGQAVEPELFGGLVHLVEDDLGLQLYRAIEQAKMELSRQERTRLVFVDEDLEIDEPVERSDFESWIAPELSEIEEAVDRLLMATGTGYGPVDRVFLTGGSSFVPAVRRVFSDRFGEDRIASGDELTSVAQGLALRGLDD